MSGRKVKLDEIVVPVTSEKSVPVMPTPTGQEVNDDDHGTSDQVTTESRR